MKDPHYAQSIIQEIHISQISILTLISGSFALVLWYLITRLQLADFFINAFFGPFVTCCIPFAVIWKTPKMWKFFCSRHHLKAPYGNVVGPEIVEDAASAEAADATDTADAANSAVAANSTIAAEVTDVTDTVNAADAVTWKSPKMWKFVCSRLHMKPSSVYNIDDADAANSTNIGHETQQFESRF